MPNRMPIAVLLVVAALPFPALRATPVNMDVLLNNSPFSGPAAAPAAANTKTDSLLEFRGVLVDRGETFFSLYETASHFSLWVGLS